jgi:hypothetical protein
LILVKIIENFLDPHFKTIFLLGAILTKLLSKLLKNFVALGLNILRLFRLKVFFKQISFEVDATYNKNNNNKYLFFMCNSSSNPS